MEEHSAPAESVSRAAPSIEGAGSAWVAGSSASDDAASPPSPHQPFGHSLEPVLAEACGGRLSEVHWFRTDWQRGGALTGHAVYRDDQGVDQRVVAKLPLPPRELQWLLRLQGASGLVPKVYAHGQTLGQYDMAWVVMERLPHGPLGHAWSGVEFDLLIQAAGRFYAAANEASPLNEPAPKRDWDRVFQLARQNLQEHDLIDEQRWKNALKKAHRKLKDWVAIWEARPVRQWCHGDLHLANALTREPAPAGPAVLIDFAQVHAGHWVEDAVYFEHLFWARRQRLDGRRLCSMMAQELKRHGLPVDADWPRLASVRRALMAMSTPAMLSLDGDKTHVRAALQVLETEVGV